MKMKQSTCTLISLAAMMPCVAAFSAPSFVMSPSKRGRTFLKSEPNSEMPTPDVDAAADPQTQTDTSTIEDEEQTVVTSFLKFIGPYPTMALRFPTLATSSQREREVSGISLDFVIDTAANTNTINAQVAQELLLETVGEALPGYGAGGAISGGDTYMLGNCTLDNKPETELFMTELTASALPVASPASAGLLGVAFLNCFQGGVKFDWGGGIDQKQPFVTFYGTEEDSEDLRRGMTKVPIDIIDDVYLPSVKIVINNVEIPALLDTGSPVTVLNSVAANLVGLDVLDTLKSTSSDKDDKKKKGGFNLNPFQKISENFKEAQAMAQAAQRGDILVLAGTDGQRIELKRTSTNPSISLNSDAGSSASGGKDAVSFPATSVYVGDLPGLAALGGLGGDSSPPAAVLGMDVLKRLPAMIYRQNEVYF